MINPTKSTLSIDVKSRLILPV